MDVSVLSTVKKTKFTPSRISYFEGISTTLTCNFGRSTRGQTNFDYNRSSLVGKTIIETSFDVKLKPVTNLFVVRSCGSTNPQGMMNKDLTAIRPHAYSNFRAPTTKNGVGHQSDAVASVVPNVPIAATDGHCHE